MRRNEESRWLPHSLTWVTKLMLTELWKRGERASFEAKTIALYLDSICQYLWCFRYWNLGGNWIDKYDDRCDRQNSRRAPNDSHALVQPSSSFQGCAYGVACDSLLTNRVQQRWWVTTSRLGYIKGKGIGTGCIDWGVHIIGKMMPSSGEVSSVREPVG